MSKSHTTDETENKFTSIKPKTAVMSGGLTLVVKPIKASLSKLLKDNVRSQQLIYGGNSFTKSGNIVISSTGVIDFLFKSNTDSLIQCFSTFLTMEIPKKYFFLDTHILKRTHRNMHK